jgi:hypothetical protein
VLVNGKQLSDESVSNAKLLPAVATLVYAASVDLNLAPSVPVYRTLALTGNVTFTTSNLVAGRQASVRIVADGSIRTLTFPAGWKFLGAAAPANIAASKTAVLSIVSFGVADADVVVAYSVQP